MHIVSEKIGSLKVLPREELKGLNTKRLLAYKKSVLAQKSALYEKNKETLNIKHPFDVAKDITWDYDLGPYVLGSQTKKLVEDARDYSFLCDYHNHIKEILSTREHVE